MTTLIAGTQTHLFTVRLWLESVGGGTVEVRYQVRHVLSGETRYFRTWRASLEFMQEMIAVDDKLDAISCVLSDSQLN